MSEQNREYSHMITTRRSAPDVAGAAGGDGTVFLHIVLPVALVAILPSQMSADPWAAVCCAVGSSGAVW